MERSNNFTLAELFQLFMLVVQFSLVSAVLQVKRLWVGGRRAARRFGVPWCCAVWGGVWRCVGWCGVAWGAAAWGRELLWYHPAPGESYRVCGRS